MRTRTPPLRISFGTVLICRARWQYGSTDCQCQGGGQAVGNRPLLACSVYGAFPGCGCRRRENIGERKRAVSWRTSGGIGTIHQLSLVFQFCRSYSVTTASVERICGAEPLGPLPSSDKIERCLKELTESGSGVNDADGGAMGKFPREFPASLQGRLGRRFPGRDWPSHGLLCCRPRV
ncbi:uncharacterized protein J3D65DRAFT_46810 [Phyllosticta citribraziliensis]|uniref:Uncharacterized protein n=1 Tax=Phyllosticta citribraziliensis TaxID=989973 RepID=A0ABR1MAW7_9PEZI